jgi:hypothetical protein
MKYFAIAAVCAMTSTQALAASEQFDLVCSTNNPKDKFHLRVDLVNNEWCEDDCKEIERIIGVNSGKITFRDEGDEFKKITRRFLEVNRITGVLQSIYDDYSFFSFSSSWQCKPEEFSGLRKGEAKF